MRRQKPFVILDRDGTILVDHPYLSDPEKIEFFQNAVEALKQLKEAGFGLIVVTNQSGIGRGFFTVESLGKVHERFRELLVQKGVILDGISVFLFSAAVSELLAHLGRTQFSQDRINKGDPLKWCHLDLK